MFTELKIHKSDYSLLTLITVVFAFLFIYKRSDPPFLMWLTGGYGLAYILWGIWHHHRQHQISFKIVLEYVLVVILALAIVSTLLLG